MKLFKPQAELVHKARLKLRELSQSVKHRKPRLIIQAGCGFGKTVLGSSLVKASYDNGTTADFLVHRDFLLKQTSDTFNRWGIPHTFIANGKYFNPHSKANIGMIGSMKSRINKMRAPKLCIVDECFPAGTLIDGKAIEDIEVGDIVRSFNHDTGCMERRPVTRCFYSMSGCMVKLYYAGKEITCTPGHPFYVAGEGYIEACRLEGKSISFFNGHRLVGVRVNRVEFIPKGEPVYNIEVEGNHNYFVDEMLVHNCHHSTASTWKAIFDAWPNTTFIMLSATPGKRSDKMSLASIADDIVCGPSNRWLIENGYLSDYVWYTPTTPDMSKARVRAGDYVQSDSDEQMGKSSIIGDIVGSYMKYANGKVAVYFAPSVETSRKYADAFNYAGIPAAHIDANTPVHEREAIIKKVASGEILVLTNVSIFGEGFDMGAVAPGIRIQAVGLCRPTKSLILLIQMAMRCMRANDNDEKGIILDHAGSYKEHDWLPDDEIDWTLEEVIVKDRSTTFQCGDCGATIRRGAVVCSHCGGDNSKLSEKIRARKEAKHKAGELIRLEREENRARAKQEEAERAMQAAERKKEDARAQSFEALLALEKERGHKPGWAWYKWTARQSRRSR